MEKVCTDKNHPYKHNEQINKQNINKPQKNIVLVDYAGIFFLHFPILLTDDCSTEITVNFIVV
jgi:hypothetical protein